MRLCPWPFGPNAKKMARWEKRPCPMPPCPMPHVPRFVRFASHAAAAAKQVKNPHEQSPASLSYSKKRAAWLLFVYYYIVKTESLRDLRFWALWAPTPGIGDGLTVLGGKKKTPPSGGARRAGLSGLGSRVPVLMNQVQQEAESRPLGRCSSPHRMGSGPPPRSPAPPCTHPPYSGFPPCYGPAALRPSPKKENTFLFRLFYFGFFCFCFNYFCF